MRQWLQFGRLNDQYSDCHVRGHAAWSRMELIIYQGRETWCNAVRTIYQIQLHPILYEYNHNKVAAARLKPMTSE